MEAARQSFVAAGDGAGPALVRAGTAGEAVEAEAAAFVLARDMVAVQAGVPLLLSNAIETVGTNKPGNN